MRLDVARGKRSICSTSSPQLVLRQYFPRLEASKEQSSGGFRHCNGFPKGIQGIQTLNLSLTAAFPASKERWRRL